MAFKKEEEFQRLIHENPSIILNGIPEINPDLCDNTPKIVSLGTEINILGKKVDNLFIDTNGILTIVECKLYGDTRIDREVYPQIINYASGIKEKLKDFMDEDEYLKEFFNLVKNTAKSKNLKFKEEAGELIKYLISEEEMLEQKDLNEWESDFKKYFKKNIEEEIFRLIIACAPRIDKKNNSNEMTVNNFDHNRIKNLIQIVNFSESKSNKYDLIIMDSRLKEKSKKPETIKKNDMVSRIIWRNYDSLRQIPLISNYRRTRVDRDEFFIKLKKEGELKKDEIERIKTLLDNFKNKENEDNGKSIDWLAKPCMKYKKINFGQIDINGEYIGTERLKVDEGDEKIYFEKLKKIFPNSDYRSSGESKTFYADDKTTQKPNVAKLSDKNIHEFNKIINDFIDECLRDS